jgi:hypothetical protein
MAPLLSDDQARHLRLRAQRLALLAPQVKTRAALVVKELCGLQAQEPPAAALAVRVRSSGLVAADVEHARVHERSIIRTWGPRGTLHLLATADLGWLLPLLGPVFVAAGQRRRTELGLDEDLCVRAIHLIRNILANQGPLTRAELVEQLAAQGIQLEGQARPHLLGRAALEGMICFGPDRGAEPTYVLLSDWVDHERRGSPMSEAAALAELTRRYLSAYGPATPQDQATWSGLSLSKTRAAWQHIADQLMEVAVACEPAWMLKTCAARLDEPPAPAPIVRLLPRFDVYLLGYQNRDLAVPRQYAKRINAGGGILHPTVLVDGRAVGIWKSRRKKNELEVLLEPFEQLTSQVYQRLEAEVTDFARFLEVQAVVKITTPQ